MNTPNQIPKGIPEFAMQEHNGFGFALRYLIKESTQKVFSSWCGTGEETTVVRTKPMLQYSIDGITWIDVLTEIEKC